MPNFVCLASVPQGQESGPWRSGRGEAMAETARTSWTDQFPGNFMWSNAMLVCKGMAPYGAVALSDLDRIAAELEGAEVTGEAWRLAWTRRAAAVVRDARAAEAAGRTRTAGTLWLRAGNYLYTAERFVPPGPEKRALGQEAFDAYHRGLRLKHPEIAFMDIPCDGAMLPALFMPAQGVTGPAPTVVVVNGMDNCKEMSVLFAGLEFAARGINTLALDGPGQGEARRLRDIPARADYEVPAAAALAALSARPDVDADRVAIMGYSFGGAYAARIAARAPGFCAGIALTAGHWDLAAYQRAVLEKQKAAQKAVAQSNFQFQWVVGADTPEAALDLAEAFGVKHNAPHIRIPFLVTHGGNDRVVPVANAQKFHDAIPPDVPKALHIVPAGEGGCEHAHVDDRPRGICIAADWLEGVLASLAERAPA